MTTLAGQGGYGTGNQYANGQGTNAAFYYPSGVAVANGLVFVADTVSLHAFVGGCFDNPGFKT